MEATPEVADSSSSASSQPICSAEYLGFFVTVCIVIRLVGVGGDQQGWEGGSKQTESNVRFLPAPTSHLSRKRSCTMVQFETNNLVLFGKIQLASKTN